jgi:hypothetical protein
MKMEAVSAYETSVNFHQHQPFYSPTVFSPKTSYFLQLPLLEHNSTALSLSRGATSRSATQKVPQHFLESED